MVTAMKANLVALKYPAARAASKADDPVSFHSLLKLPGTDSYKISLMQVFIF